MKPSFHEGYTKFKYHHGKYYRGRCVKKYCVQCYMLGRKKDLYGNKCESVRTW